MKLTQIHTYNGVFAGTNYRTTHFHPMSRHSFLTVYRRGNDNTRLPGVKEEKWRLPDVDKTHPSFREPYGRTSFRVAVFTRSAKLLRIFKKLLPRNFLTWTEFSDVDTSRTSRALAKVRRTNLRFRKFRSHRTRLGETSWHAASKKFHLSNKILSNANKIEIHIIQFNFIDKFNMIKIIVILFWL